MKILKYVISALVLIFSYSVFPNEKNLGFGKRQFVFLEEDGARNYLNIVRCVTKKKNSKCSLGVVSVFKGNCFVSFEGVAVDVEAQKQGDSYFFTLLDKECDSKFAYSVSGDRMTISRQYSQNQTNPHCVALPTKVSTLKSVKLQIGLYQQEFKCKQISISSDWLKEHL